MFFIHVYIILRQKKSVQDHWGLEQRSLGFNLNEFLLRTFNSIIVTLKNKGLEKEILYLIHHNLF